MPLIILKTCIKSARLRLYSIMGKFNSCSLSLYDKCLRVKSILVDCYSRWGGFCNCYMFCCALLCVHSSSVILSMGKRELVALLCLSSWCLVIIVWLFLTMPRVCLQFVIVVFPDPSH